jgi:hypothetical protein
VNPTQELEIAAKLAKEKRDELRYLLILPWALSEWMIVGPLLHARDGQRELLILMFFSFLPIFGVIGGIQALLFPENPRRWPMPIAVGTISTLVFLCAAPAAFHLSFLEYKSQPYWMVTTLVGTSTAFAYLVAAARWWKSRAMPPNKSLERTREG